jgi:pimeloyl-ACP methyl ester carboxylesterase
MTRPTPVMFVHGFNGDPGDWTDSGFRQWLLAQGDLDADLVRLFRYGIAADGTYNNRGDLREIASRLAGAGLNEKDLLTSSVDRLSRDSVAKGGPAQVTLVAHSLGGIISRYYLSRRSPDPFGTLYRGNVGRLITIGSPHRGVDLLRLTRLAPKNSVGWRFLRLLERLGLAPALPASAITAWEQTLEREQTAARARWAAAAAPSEPRERVPLTETPIYQQLAPDSPLLAELNAGGALPDGVACHCIFGDIRVAVVVRAGPLTLIDETVSFGDFAVAAHSAREIPAAASTSHPFVTEQRLALTVRGRPRAQQRPLNPRLPETAHANLLSNRAVHDLVLSLLKP